MTGKYDSGSVTDNVKYYKHVPSVGSIFL